jgi:TPR repeat protein
MKAAALFRAAADAGNATAGSYLAWCYFHGEGVEQSCASAVEWGRKAADQGDAEAQFLVGRHGYGLADIIARRVIQRTLNLRLSS